MPRSNEAHHILIVRGDIISLLGGGTGARGAQVGVNLHLTVNLILSPIPGKYAVKGNVCGHADTFHRRLAFLLDLTSALTPIYRKTGTVVTLNNRYR